MKAPLRLLRALLFLICAATSLAQADTGKRVALVIGMSNYRNIPVLDNPKNDARLIAQTLKELGFTLVGNGSQLDLDKAGLDRAVQAFGTQVAGADVAFFYYAGHGLQVRGTNWLVPVGANPSGEKDLDFQMVDAQLVLRQMEASGTRLNLVVLDACRNNPFGGRGLRAATGGLAQMQAPEGTLISYATQPGNTAQDGEGGNSPYTHALSETLRTPGMEVRNVFNQVGLKVKRATGGTQQPWMSASPIDGDFYFAGTPSGNQTQLASLEPVPARPTTPSTPASRPSRPTPTASDDPDTTIGNSLGLSTSDLTEEQKKEMKLDHGVLVENADGAAQRAGIRPGDVILRLKDTDITDAKQFNALVGKLDPKKAAALLVLRGESPQFILVKPLAQ